MREMILDNPLPIYVVLGLAEVLIALLWYRGKARPLAIALLVPLLLAAVVAALGLFIETDRQKIQKALREIATDVERGDLRAAATKYLADDFSGFYGDTEGAIRAGETARKMYGIQTVGLSDVKIDVDESLATVTARTTISYKLQGFGEGRATLDWKVYWVQSQGQWKIARVEQPHMANGL